VAQRLRRRRRPLTFPEISLTPLIDTAFTLLIIFMITAPMMRMTIKVDLPDAKTSEVTKVEDQNLTVEMDLDGVVHFGGKSYNLKQGKKDLQALRESISRSVTKQNNTVFLFADKTLRYERIIKLFDVINAIDGVQHVALVTQKVE
jgi:biopolymer transport protein ExbD